MRPCPNVPLVRVAVADLTDRMTEYVVLHVLKAAGYPIVLTVHDEIIAEVPDGVGSLDEFKRLLVAAPAWTEGLPIAAKVREAPRYSKPATGEATVDAVAISDEGSPSREDVDDYASRSSEAALEPADDAAPPWVMISAPSSPVPSPGEPADAFKALEASDATSSHVVLVDGNTLVHRAHHAAARDNSDAVRAFRRILQAALQEAGPATHLAIVFDAPGPTFRHKIYPEYKATRKPVADALTTQLPLMREAARELGPCVEQPDVEADDVIATYTRLARESGMTVTLVASDKDLMQLVGDGVTMYAPDPKKRCRIGVAEVRAKFGVPPHQVVDVQALMGDKADNVPGVLGIGKVNAALLITEYGDLETLLSRATEIKQLKIRQALIENADKVRRSRQLVQLDDAVTLDVPLDALAVQQPAPPPPDETPKSKGNGRDIEAPPPGAAPGGPDGTGHGERDTGTQVAFFVYKHADGSPYLGVKKTSTKQFPQYHLDGAKWVKGPPQGLEDPVSAARADQGEARQVGSDLRR